MCCGSCAPGHNGGSRQRGFRRTRRSIGASSRGSVAVIWRRRCAPWLDSCMRKPSWIWREAFSTGETPERKRGPRRGKQRSFGFRDRLGLAARIEAGRPNGMREPLRRERIPRDMTCRAVHNLRRLDLPVAPDPNSDRAKQAERGIPADQHCRIKTDAAGSYQRDCDIEGRGEDSGTMFHLLSWTGRYGCFLPP